MSQLPFTSNTLTFRELIGNGRLYSVPRFQRDYSWKEEQWEDLWQDIIELDVDSKHFMGYVLFQDDKIEENGIIRDGQLIIDGQQRFATLSILALAFIYIFKKLANSNIEKDKNEERVLLYKEMFIGRKEGISLTVLRKLRLNKNNDDFYQNYLVELRTPDKNRNLSATNRKLLEAFEFFCKKLAEYSKNDNGSKLAALLENIVGSNLIFISITAQNDLNAFSVFETLNARGVRLSTADLLKNLLFSKIALTGDIDLVKAESIWSNVVNSLSKEAGLANYIRVYWNSRYGTIRKNDVYKKLKEYINNDNNRAFDLINSLDYDVAIYSALIDPSQFREFDNDQRKNLKVLSSFGFTQCIPLLLSAYKAFPNSKEFSKILRDIVLVSFRYQAICGLNPNKLEGVYHNAAKSIFEGKYKNASQVFKAMSSVFVDDDQFIAAFRSHFFFQPDNKLIKYILCEIENAKFGKNFSWEDTSISIEHITPLDNTTWNQDWIVDKNNPILEARVYQIGNLALLDSKSNSKLGNKDFMAKKSVYQRSLFETTKHLGNEVQIWNLKAFEQRQDWLAKLARDVWKNPYSELR